MPIIVMRSALAAAHLFSGKQDVRAYLNGVRIEPSEKETRLIATDGASLALLRHIADNSDGPGAVTIPSQIVAQCITLKTDWFAIEGGPAAFTISGGGASFQFTEPHGQFPTYRRILRTTVSGEAASFDPALVHRFVQAAKALGLKRPPIIRQNGKDAAVVHFYGYEDFIGVLSPFNHFTEKFPDQGFPTWGGL